MSDIWIGLLFCCVAWYFYHQRKLAELARIYAQKYCEENNLQFISIARIKSRLAKDQRQGLNWHNEYQFEFSGDGESRYEGTLTMLGAKIKQVDLPVYRIN